MIYFDQEAEYALTPGQPLPADAKTSMQSLAETATITATSSESTSSTTSTAAAGETTDAATSSGSGSSGLSTGAIVGIAVGGAALLALAGGLFWYVWLKSFEYVRSHADLFLVSYLDTCSTAV